MLVRYTKKYGKYDELSCIREDGSVHSVKMPKIRNLPHDLVHIVVEKVLNLENGFYGHVKKGLVDGYYLKTERTENPEKNTIDAQHAESLVECFQAEFNSGQQSAEYFQGILNVTCAARNIPNFVISAHEIEKIRNGLFELDKTWNSVKIGETFEIEF